MKTHRMLTDWASDNIDILDIGDLFDKNNVYTLMSVKYSSWRTVFEIDSNNPREKDDVLNMLWRGYVSTSLPKLKNAIDALSLLNGKKQFQKTINGTLVKTGDTTRTPNLSDETINGTYTDTTTNSGFTETGETINSSVAYNTFSEKNREKSEVTNTTPEKTSSVKYGENTSTLKRTGSETNNVNLKDVNDVTESGFETSPDFTKTTIDYANKQPIYDFIDRFVRQFFTF